MKVKLLFVLYIFIVSMVSSAGEPAAAGNDSIEADIVKTRILQEYRRNPAIIRLEKKDSGEPVIFDELETVHTEKIHLLIIDPTLSDYHHEHPMPTNVNGEYIFAMTPKTPCGYRVWADIDTVTGEQQYLMTDIEGEEDCSGKSVNKKTNSVYEDENYRITLGFNTNGLSVGKDSMATITVRETNGRYVRELQPFMGTYAHLVGFYDDYKTIAHIHPVGENPMEEDDRGGPKLEFYIKPEKAGYLKLFAQFKINNMIVFAPFGVNVKGGAGGAGGAGGWRQQKTVSRPVADDPFDPFGVSEQPAVKKAEPRKKREEENIDPEAAWEQELAKMAEERRKRKKEREAEEARQERKDKGLKEQESMIPR
jgi:hypothetical protein